MASDDTWHSGVVEPPQGPGSGEIGPSPAKGTLPTGMKDEQRRLAAAALHFAAGFAAFVPFIEWTAFGSDHLDPIRLAAEAATVAFAGAVLLVARAREDLRYRTIAALGQALLVVGAVGISMVEQWRPMPPDVAWPGLPWAGVWLLVFPFVGPTGAARLSIVAAAASAPAVAGLAVAVGVREPPTWLGWAGVIGPVFAAAVLNFLPALALLNLSEERTGPYRLLKPIGRGGMGEVWLATHKLLARPAAVKLIRGQAGLSSRDRTARETEVRRFHREASATSRLQSPHTVRLFDYGVAADGRFFYVMELLHGLDLEQLVRRFGPVPAERAVHLVAQACLSLAEAHQQGVVHRDVKPSNLFTCSAGTEVDFLKVLDFGLVAAEPRPPDGTPSADQSLETRHTTVIGTPPYIAPEVLLGHPSDARSDVYALGGVLYWLLAARSVFDRPTFKQVLEATVRDEPKAPGVAAALEVPAALDAVVLACLAKNPAARPDSMLELRDRLLEIETPGRWTEERAQGWWQRHLPPAVHSAS